MGFLGGAGMDGEGAGEAMVRRFDSYEGWIWVRICVWMGGCMEGCVQVCGIKNGRPGSIEDSSYECEGGCDVLGGWREV